MFIKQHHQESEKIFLTQVTDKELISKIQAWQKKKKKGKKLSHFPKEEI